MAAKTILLTEAEVEAAKAFNARMAAARAPSDFVAEHVYPTAAGALITKTQYVVVDGEAVRGGVLKVEYPAWLNGSPLSATNYQSPISEGIIDKKQSLTAMVLVKFMQQAGSRSFVVGMGDAGNPLPRLLKAAGWSVEPIPFFFRVCRPNRFLLELQLLKDDPKRRVLARLAAATGAGWLGIRTLQSRGIPAGIAARKYRIQQVAEWGSWADILWERFRNTCSFGVLRDCRTLAELYPASDARLIRFLLEHGGRPVGWAACFNSQMNGHRIFGNLRVATILDCTAEPEHALPLIASAVQELHAAGADLVVTNQTHRSWREAFHRCGFLTSNSNYLLAMSPVLAKDLAPARESIHVTRGDGDGRIHL
ncbi:MAG TPA: hypothetical protein VGK64_28065 [Bryobacteraceae bacterium]